MASRTRDPEARIAAIKNAAAEILVEHGPEGLTHRAVAAKAEVALGTTTKYFATKDDLRLKALEQLWSETEEELLEIHDGLNHAKDDPASRSTIIADFIHLHLSDSRLLRTECALICNGLLYEDLRQISLRWYEGFSEALSPHYSATTVSILTRWYDGSTLHTALTGQAPEKHQIQVSINQILN